MSRLVDLPWGVQLFLLWSGVGIDHPWLKELIK